MVATKGCAMAWAMTIWVNCTATSNHGIEQPKLLPKAMSTSVALLQPGCVLMSMVPVIIGSSVDAQSWGLHLEFSWGPRATLKLG